MPHRNFTPNPSTQLSHVPSQLPVQYPASTNYYSSPKAPTRPPVQHPLSTGEREGSSQQHIPSRRDITPFSTRNQSMEAQGATFDADADAEGHGAQYGSHMDDFEDDGNGDGVDDDEDEEAELQGLSKEERMEIMADRNADREVDVLDGGDDDGCDNEIRQVVRDNSGASDDLDESGELADPALASGSRYAIRSKGVKRSHRSIISDTEDDGPGRKEKRNDEARSTGNRAGSGVDNRRPHSRQQQPSHVEQHRSTRAGHPANNATDNRSRSRSHPPSFAHSQQPQQQQPSQHRGRLNSFLKTLKRPQPQQPSTSTKNLNANHGGKEKHRPASNRTHKPGPPSRIQKARGGKMPKEQQQVRDADPDPDADGIDDNNSMAEDNGDEEEAGDNGGAPSRHTSSRSMHCYPPAVSAALLLNYHLGQATAAAENPYPMVSMLDQIVTENWDLVNEHTTSSESEHLPLTNEYMPLVGFIISISGTVRY